MLKTHLALAAMMAGILTEPTSPKLRIVHDEPFEALINEYKLIQEKKSKLSKRQRDSVEYRYHLLVKRGIIMP